MHGIYDSDVTQFEGIGRYSHIQFSNNSFHFKSTLLVHQANHGQWNTHWGKFDNLVSRWFLNVKPLLEPEAQVENWISLILKRGIAQIYFSAFFQIALLGKRELLPIFQDHRVISNLLPKTNYFNLYQDSKFTHIANFEEDSDITTTSFVGGSIEVSLALWFDECETYGLSFWAEYYITILQSKVAIVECSGDEIGDRKSVV